MSISGYDPKRALARSFQDPCLNLRRIKRNAADQQNIMAQEILQFS